jgi:cytochrome c oxidase subunit 2
MWNFPLLPESASTIAGEIDAIWWVLVALSVFFSVIIVTGLAVSAIRYRKGSKHSRAGATSDNLLLELSWSIIPLAISLVIFAWSSKVFIDMRVAPAGAMNVYVVGKQWMWKIQHPEGNREINELHVPIGKPVKLIMTSQDVIHSFFIPAFRIKADALPGRYTTQWFEATKAGEYHLFCAEYCGTSHSGMVGRVVAMEPAAYEDWLSGKRGGDAMSSSGEKLFAQFGCQTCHRNDSGQRGPALDGLWGTAVTLTNGDRVAADAEYVRESILNPGAKIVKGFQLLMPTYKTQLTPEQVNELVEYVKTLGGIKTGEKK